VSRQIRKAVNPRRRAGYGLESSGSWCLDEKPLSLLIRVKAFMKVSG